MVLEAWLTLGLLVVMFAVLAGDKFPTWLVAQKDGGYRFADSAQVPYSPPLTLGA